MKRLLPSILLIVGLTACAGASSFGKHNCSAGGEVCIEVCVDEPIFFGEPVIVTITVTSEKNISRLGVSLYHNVDITVEGPQGWEEDLQNVTIYKSGASWGVPITASRPAIFIRKLILSPREGDFYIIARASTLELEAVDMIRIYITKEGGKVYRSGTPIPITPGPLPTIDSDTLATLQAMPTATPYPTMPPVPTTKTPPAEILDSTAYPPPEDVSAPTSPSPELLDTPAYPPPYP